MRVAAISTALFFLLVLVAVFTANRWLVLITMEAERRFMAPYIEFAGKHFIVPVSAAPESHRYLAGIVGGVARTLTLPNGFRPEVHLVDSKASNAFAALGGHIFISTALLRSLSTENSLAMVLAHEIAHVANRDAIKGAGRALLFNLLFYLATGQSNAEAISRFGSDTVLSGFSRKQERKADLDALNSLYKRYGHVAGATTFLEQQDKSERKSGEPFEQDGDRTIISDYTASHPDLSTRLEYLKAKISVNKWRAGKEIPYPQAVASELQNNFRKP